MTDRRPILGIVGGDRLLAQLRLLASARGESPWSTSLLNATRIITAGLVVLDGVMGALAGAPHLGEGLLGWIGLTLACSALVVMGAVLVRNVAQVRWHAGAVGLLLLGLSLALWHGSTTTPWPVHYLTAALLFVVVAGQTWHRLPLILLIVTFQVLARSVSWLNADLPFGVGFARDLAVELGHAACAAGVMFVIVHVVSVTGEMADRAFATAMRETRQLALATARERTAREVDRFVHDEVVDTLRTIAMDRSVVSARTAVAAAARLDRLLSQNPLPTAGGGSLTERLAAAAAALPLDVQVGGEESVTVPPDIEDAFVLAALEALRNVVRHAGVAAADVRVRRDGLTVEVEVSDAGSGFDPATVPPQRGIDSSIFQRMRDVGGAARLESHRGEGTTVRLSWAAASPAPRFSGGIGHGALKEMHAPAALIAVPYLIFGLWNAAWLSPELAAPWAGWVSAVTLTVATGFVLLRALRHGPRAWMAVVLLAATWGATALNGWALPTGVADLSLLWAGTSALAAIVPLTLFYHPGTIALAGLGTAVVTTALALARAGSDLAAGDIIVAAVQPALSVVGYLAARLMLDALAWEVFRAGEESARAQAQAQNRSEFVGILTDRMRKRRDTIASFVRDVAVGRLPAGDPKVRNRADNLERSVREQMLPELADTLHLVATQMRALGHMVTVRVSEDAPVEIQRRSAHALAAALAAAGEDRADATVTIMRAASAWRAAVLIANPSQALASAIIARLGAAWAVEERNDILHLSSTTALMADNG